MIAPESSTGATPSQPNIDLARPWKRVWRLCMKELRETLRDRRTMITLILMPLIVYPILSIIFQRFLVETWQTTQAPTCIVGVQSEADAELLSSVVRMTTRLRESHSDREAPSTSAGHDSTAVQRNWPSDDWLDYEIKLAKVDNLAAAVGSEMVDVGLRISETDNSQVPAWVEIVHRPGSYNSRQARQTLERYFSMARDAYFRQQLQSASVGNGLPIQMRYRAISSAPTGSLSIATLIPLALVLMTVTGAVYPAIDLTAGERERGTMEAPIATPVPRMGLLFAKYVAVVTVAVLTATANLLAMTVTLWSSGVAQAIFGDSSAFTFSTLLSVFGLMVLFAAFFSSVLLTVTSFARSFKEAQAYLIPLILLSLGPSLFCLAPGLELSGVLAVTPLVNIVLLARNALEGQVVPSMAILCVISTLLYAAAALAIAAKVFGSDAILYGSPSGWRDVFRRAERPQAAPTLASAFGGLAVLFPVYVILAGLLAQLKDAPLSLRLTLIVLVTAGLFGALPWLIALWGRVTSRDGFQLRRPSWLSLLGGLALGLSAWPMLQMLVIWQGSVSEEQFDLVEAFHRQARELSPWVIVLSMAVVPAVFEELFFRGFLFSALRERLSASWTILVTAMLFGAFHVLAKSALATERFLPTTCMGLMLGWVCWRTYSVIPGMLLHACHNAALLMMFYYRDELEAAGFGTAQSETLPISWLLASVCGMALGILLVTLGRSRPPASMPPTKRREPTAAQQRPVNSAQTTK